MEAYFLWDWDKKLDKYSLGHFVINRVLDIKIVGRDGLILFDNGDALSIPFKDYEKPYYRESKRQHGDETYREGYAIDFNGCIQKMRDKFIGEYVVYSTRLISINVGNLTGFEIYRDSPYREHAEKDKFLFRLEFGVIKSYGAWNTDSIPIYLEDGRIMIFRYSDYYYHIDQSCDNTIIYQLKEYLKTVVGKLYKFLACLSGCHPSRENFPPAGVSCGRRGCIGADFPQYGLKYSRVSTKNFCFG